MRTSRDERRFALALVVACLLFGNAIVWIARTAPDDTTQSVAVSAAPAVQRGVLEVARTLQSLPPPAPPSTLPAEPASAPRPAVRPKPAPRNGAARDRSPVVQIGTIEIPKIGLHHAVFEGNTLTQIDHGPSHWPGSALPGQPGNAVFAGHRVTKTRPFRNIDQLAPGDRVHFTIHGVRTTYAVTGSQVVSPKDVWIINPTPTPTATLFACHPPGSARYRYVVRLALVPGE